MTTPDRTDALRRIVAALPRRIVGQSARLMVYTTTLAVIYRIYAGDLSAIPLLAASPILARLVEEVGGSLLSNLIERVARDDELGPEDIIARLEEALDSMSDDLHEALTRNEQLLTLIYRLLVSLDIPAGTPFEEIAMLTALAQPAAVAVPRTPHLLARIGHDDELQSVSDLLAEIDLAGRGQTIFLMGPLGSGRAAFAAEVAAAASEDFRTASIRFAPTEVETAREMTDHLRLGRRRAHVEAILETFPVTAKQAVHRPWTDLMIQLSQAGASAGPSGAADEIETLGHYVRSAARVGPLVITIDNLDWAPGYWIDLLPRLAREIALELPVLLLVSLESPAPLAELDGPRHTEPTRLGQKLVAEGTAATRFLGPITYDDIAHYIQPAAGELAARLRYLADGDPKTVELLWLEWLAQGAVVPDDGGRWVVTEADERWWVFGDMADHARHLLAETLDGWDDPPPFTLEATEALLSCAALEGETFTLRAVAAALDMDADVLADFFDSYLLPYDDPDDRDNNQAGILEEAGFTPVDDFRKLFQYRFARPYLHHVWAKYPAAPEQVDEWRRALPLALEGLYYPYGYRIAGDLARLFAAAGLPDKAEEYRRFGRRQQSLEELRRYIQPLLESVPENKYEAYRLFDAGFAFLEKLLSQRSDLWRESYGIGRRLGALARCCEDWEYEAKANLYMALSLSHGGQARRGLHWARRSESLYTRNGVDHVLDLDFKDADLEKLATLTGSQQQDQHGLASFDIMIGFLLQAMGDLPAARPYYERALAVRERVLGPEHPDTAAGLNNLGALLVELGRVDEGRPFLERALAIYTARLGPDHPDTKVTAAWLRGV